MFITKLKKILLFTFTAQKFSVFFVNYKFERDPS